MGPPPHEVRRYHARFSYHAGSWTKPRRVVAKMEWHPDELYPCVAFIVTNMSRQGGRRIKLSENRCIRLKLGRAEGHRNRSNAPGGAEIV